MDSDTVLAILKRAVNAPSGENCQPWKFSWSNSASELQVFNIPERDTSLYNTQQSGSLIAQGALIENIAIIATTYKFRTLVTVEESLKQVDLVATLRFESAPEITPDVLSTFIEKRCTNRKMYKPVTLTQERLAELRDAVGQKSVSVTFLENKEDIAEISGAMSMNERMVFEHPQIHDFFFSHIRWTKEEEEKEKNGFYLPTLELDAKQQKAMNIFKRWNIVKVLNHVGVSRMIASDNKKNYASSSLIGALFIEKTTKPDLIAVGRAFQRIWLTVTKQGLSLQPATGIVLLKLATESNRADQFTIAQRNIIDTAYLKFEKLLKPAQKKIAVMFRIGDGGEPSAYSQKMEPKVSFN
jgi:nitroreductase